MRRGNKTLTDSRVTDSVSISKKCPPRRFFWSQTSPYQEGLTFFWLQTSPRDDRSRFQTSPQKSLPRLDVSKKLEFSLRQKSQKHENCPPTSTCRWFMKEIAMRTHMSAFSNKTHTDCTKKRYSVFCIRKI